MFKMFKYRTGGALGAKTSDGTYTNSQSQSHITTDSQSASPSWCQAPIWDPRPIFYLLEIFLKTVPVRHVVAPL
jgi:hypothetical protein